MGRLLVALSLVPQFDAPVSANRGKQILVKVVPVNITDITVPMSVSELKKRFDGAVELRSLVGIVETDNIILGARDEMTGVSRIPGKSKTLLSVPIHDQLRTTVGGSTNFGLTGMLRVVKEKKLTVGRFGGNVKAILRHNARLIGTIPAGIIRRLCHIIRQMGAGNDEIVGRVVTSALRTNNHFVNLALVFVGILLLAQESWVLFIHSIVSEGELMNICVWRRS